MTAFLSFYKLSSAEQLNLFYTNEEKLNLEKVEEVINDSRITYDNNGEVSGEGFINLNVMNRNDKNIIEGYCTTQGSLGNFQQAFVQNDYSIKSQAIQHKFYSKCSFIITDNSELILLFSDTSEEKTKAKAKALIEDTLGMESTYFKLTDSLFRKIQDDYKWTAAKLDKVENYGDSTKSVSYQVDPTDEESESLVHSMYNENGELRHIKFEVPYKSDHTPNTITVTLYSDGNRVVIDDKDFQDYNDLKNFVLFLYNELENIIRVG